MSALPKRREDSSFSYSLSRIVLCRIALLPIENFLDFATRFPLEHILGGTPRKDPQGHTKIWEDFRLGLSVASPSLFHCLQRLPNQSKHEAISRQALRYFIRMSTRPTPFGYFAGVALARLGAETDIAVREGGCRRTRLDMEWLLNLVTRLESMPAVRSHLCYCLNPLAFVRGNRLVIAQRMRVVEPSPPPEVSVRLTAVVKKVIELCRTPLSYRALESVLSEIIGANKERVESLLTQLFQESFLLSDLRPPLTNCSPAHYVLKRLSDIPDAAELCRDLQSVLENLHTCDSSETTDAAEKYSNLMVQVEASGYPQAKPTVQIDTGVSLARCNICSTVAREVTRAAELLLRLSPVPFGPSALALFRNAFSECYGLQREVSLLEALDPERGIGPLTSLRKAVHPNPYFSELRGSTLLRLAEQAARRGTLVIELDEQTMESLQTQSTAMSSLPQSLDLCVAIAARSGSAVNAGEYKIIVGPNTGANAGGRYLGRFCDLLGPDAFDSLQEIALAEQESDPNTLPAELVYLPRRLHSANIVLRPHARTHEIPIGVTPSVDPSHVIPVNEILIGIKNDRLYARWQRSPLPLRIYSGHMLNNQNAPAVAQFLAEVGRDSITQLCAFDWGPAENFVFLPRLQVGRIVLRPAQWKIDTRMQRRALQPTVIETFPSQLRQWMRELSVPRFIYLTDDDNRLLLDLDCPEHVEQLRIELMRVGNRVVLQEVLPTLDEAWLEGPRGHYMSEFVFTLFRQCQTPRQDGTNPAPHPQESSIPPVPVAVETSERSKPPGSNWAFVKLYCPRSLTDELIACSLPGFAAEMIGNDIADKWFFLRFQDPDNHIRLRFSGAPTALVGELMPRLFEFANKLHNQGLVTRICVDTYEREVERFGGVEGMALSEMIFYHDSVLVSELVSLLHQGSFPFDRTELAVFGVAILLKTLDIQHSDLRDWVKSWSFSTIAGGDRFRAKKQLLRDLVAGDYTISNLKRGPVQPVKIGEQILEMRAIVKSLWKIEETGILARPVRDLFRSYVHLHCNRLGLPRPSESVVLALLLRTWDSLAQFPPFRIS